MSKPKGKIPEPLASMKRFVGELLFGSTTHKGKKTLHRLAIATNNYIDSISEYIYD